MKILEIAIQKKILRENLIKQRNSIDSQEKYKNDTSIKEFVLKTVSELNAGGVLTYVSMKSEADTLMVIDELISKNIKVAVPKCVGDGKMLFYEIKDRKHLISGQYGVMEPDSGTPVCKSDYEICIVPALSIDKNGVRIGYGKGYYDNFLADYDGVSFGLCYEKLFAKSLPHEEFDQKIDMIITESGVKRVVD